MIDKRIWICAAILLLAATTGTAAALEGKEQLGKSIFFDQSLSINNNQACASCHGPEAGWTGPDSNVNAHEAIYEGSIRGMFGNRKPPTSAYATTSPVLMNDYDEFTGGNFWDGRATGEKLGNPAADQAQGPFLNPVEQALPDAACVVYRVCNAENYQVEYEDVWGEDTCEIEWPANMQKLCKQSECTIALSDQDRTKVNTNFDNIALSIEAYEASSESNAFTSKYDYFLNGEAVLTKQESSGLELFNNKGNCAACHPITTGPYAAMPLFTDYTFDNLGIPKNLENPVYRNQPSFIDTGLGGFLETTEDWSIHAEANMGKHKVPTLRNVDKRPNKGFVKSYSHNGYFKSLEAIVHFYNTRDVLAECTGNNGPEGINCWPVPELADNVNKVELGELKLTPDEEKAIVAFMKTLSDGYIPCYDDDDECENNSDEIS